MGWEDAPLIKPPAPSNKQSWKEAPLADDDSLASTEQSAAIPLLRPVEFAARGFAENAARALGALPELSSTISRSVGLPAPESGFYPEKILEGYNALGKFVSEPLNRALGTTDASGRPTGKFGPSEPVGVLEKGAMGIGRGVADVGTVMVPGGLASKIGGLTGTVGKEIISQPGVQVLAGSVAGATTEATENPWIGLAAALGTGVSASVTLAKIAKRGATTKAERKIIALITKIGNGNTAAGFKVVEQKIAQGGKDTALVDVLGIKGERMARGAANVPEGEAATIADDFVNLRASGRGERYQDAADTFGPRRNMVELEEQMIKNRQSIADPYYEQAYAANPAIISNEIDLILKTPYGKRALADAVEMMQNDRSLVGKIDPALTQQLKDAVVLGKMPDVKGGVAPGFNMRTLDYVKRAMYDIEQELTRSGSNTKAGIIRGQRQKLTSELDAADETGAYSKARASIETSKRELKAIELGRKFLTGDADLTAANIANMTAKERDAARIGARKAIGDLIRADSQATATKLASKKDAMWDRIRAIFPEKEVDEFKRLIDSENEKIKLERFVGPRTGSPTAGIQQDIADIGTEVPESVMTGLKVVGNLAHPFRALAALGKPAFDYFSRPNPKTAEGMASVLMELNPKTQATMLETLSRAANFKPEINIDMIRALMGKVTAAQTIGDTTPPIDWGNVPNIEIRPSTSGAQ
jgi:hypothetical protein